MSDNPFALSNIQTANDQPQRDENPFSLSSIARDQGQDLRTELQRAVRTNPDQAAEVDRLAKQYPAPKDVLLRNLQDVQLQAAVDAADEKLRTSPKLADYMRTSPWVAKQSHDDVDALTQIAQFFSDTGGSVKAGVYNASKGAAGVFRAGFELAAPPLDVLENVTSIGGNPLRRLAEGFAMLAEQNAASAKAVAPKTTGNLDSGFQSGVQSLTQNLLTLPLAFAPGGQAAALAGMVSFTGGQSYQDAREKGLPMSQALPFAASQAAIEYATEKLPLGALIKDVKAGTPFFETLAKQIAMEVPGEQLATLMQDLNEWAVLNPDKPFTSYLDERPSAAAQTLVATIVGAGGNVAVMKGIEKALTIGTDNAAKIADAERVNAGLQDAMKAAAASKLRERNPETFKQLVQHLAEENDGQAPTSVFIDAALLQGVNVAEVLPSAAEQMADALATNGSVEVSISDVLTSVPGTPLEQVFLQNARATPDGISMAEAEQAFKQADQWKAEADRVMAEAQDQAAWQASADNVKANLLGQLNTAGRFTPEVNEAYATLVRDFYATMAGRQGITPEEMYQRYPLRIAAQDVGGQQLDQATKLESVRQQWDAAGISHSIMETRSGLILSKIVVPKDGRSEGRGTTAMQALVDYADSTGQRISLTPASDFGGNKKRLVEFYKRFGFVENKGRNKDYEISEAMYRPAQALAQSAPFNGTEQATTPIGDATEVEVDGKMRPALNSNGQPIHWSVEGVRNFWRWFGDSRVVDDQGRPLVVYHSSLKDMEAFNRTGKFMGHTGTSGISVTDNPEMASRYLERYADYGWVDGKPNQPFDKNVMALYVRAENPLVSDEPIKTNLPLGAPLPANYVSPVVQWGYDALIRNDAISKKGAVKHSTAKNAIKGREIVVFDPTQIKSATGNSGAFSGQDANILRQNARGTYSPDQLLITLNANADLSTFLHESGHFFLEVMADLASQPNAPADVQDDMNRLLKWFGVADVATWQAMTLDQQRPHHERFAESFEQYLLEGKAPSQELQPLFRKFRAWLVNVYKSLTHFMRGRDLKLSDEVRQVFDRMLAAEDAIKAQEEASGLLPDFDATNEAIEKLQSRSLRDLKWTVNARNRALKALQKEAAYLRKAVEDEVRAEVERQPVYRAEKFLKYGKLDDANLTNAQRKAMDSAAGMNVKLDLAALKEMYGDGPAAQWRYLSTGKNGLAGKDGVHPDIVADMLGFESGDTLVRALLDAEPIASVVEGMTDQRMLENFGELATPEAIEEAANDAVHNEARAKSLATELKAQADMLNTREQTGTASNGRAITVNTLTRAAKEFGANLAARRKISDLKRAAQQHRAAEAKAGRAWQEATAKGQTQEAVAAKRYQVLNNAAVKALNEAQAEAKKIVEFFRKVTKDSNEKLVDKGRDPDVVNAMRAILAAYDVAPRLEKSATEYLELVARNDPAMYGALKPAVDAALANAKPLSEMTMEELRGLNDELRSMWHLAKRSRQMEIDGNLLDRQELEAQLTARMGDIGIPDTIPGERGSITAMEEAGIKLQFAKAILSRVEQWAERLDGQYGGPFLRYIFQPVKAAADRYRAARAEYRKKFTALVDNIAPLMPPGAITAPELGYTFGNAKDSGMAELLHAILHTGNDSNKRKLLLGRQWATENPDGTMDTSRWDAFITRMINEGKLTKAHYDFAQGVWDLLEEAKPLAQKAHREVFGRYFAEVTANAFDTPFGSYRGGYVPAQTDSRIVTEAKLRELAEAENESMAYAFPAAPNGFTKARVEYNKPLLLDLRTLPQHLDKVLLFSHMQPTINDVRRLLTAKSVSYGLDRIDPGAYEGMLTPWLKRSAQQVVETPVVGDRKLSRFLAAARSRAGMALMFANLSNTVQQITGFSLAAVKVKPSLMMSALGQFVANPKQTRESVATASIFMRDRMENEVAALNNVVEEILVNPSLYERSQAWTQRHAYFLQSAVDNTMAPIIWTAAYNQAIEQKMDHGEAVKYADGVIRQTQGSTLPEDVSRFETGPAMVRVFTQFVGYFNMMANTNATAVSQIVNDMGLRKGAGKLLYVALAGLFVPIWVAEAIAVAFKGGPDDEDRDGYLDDWLAAVFGIGTFKGLVAQVPIVGQAAQMIVNQFNTNPADDKFSLSPAVSLIESAVRAPKSVYDAIVNDGKAQKAVRDVATLATMLTGLPFYAAARPLGYAAGVAASDIEPANGADMARGLVTGVATKESKR